MSGLTDVGLATLLELLAEAPRLPGLSDDGVLQVNQSRDVVNITGAQACEYLQGQISQEVETMVSGMSQLSFVLDPRGKVESLFRLTRLEEDHFLADVEPGHGAALKQSLERFKLATKAEFELAQWQMLSVRGGSAETTSSRRSGFSEGATVVLDSLWPGEDLLHGTAESSTDGLASRTDWKGFDVLSASVASPTESPNSSPGTVDTNTAHTTYEWLRMLCGLPRIDTEIEIGAIPNETGLLDTAVNFDKGCYRGQELVERIDSRSGARREVVRVFSKAPLAAGAAIADKDAKAVGKVLAAMNRPAEWSLGSNETTCVGFALLRSDRSESFSDYCTLAVLP